MSTRDRYIDLLRALALIRVVAFHTFGWAWLPLLFPSMGILLALGGGLAAASIDRAGSTSAFLRKRVRRLLPPFWVFGAAMVAIMVTIGWRVDPETGSAPLTWTNAWLWVLPLAGPPSSAQGYEWTVPLWYIHTYLWFVLLSPAALWLFRRWPLRTLSVPVVTLLLLGLGLVTLEGATHEVVLQLCTYGACWLVGFAHHDGTLRRLPLWPTLAGGVGLLGAGLWYALSHREQYGTYVIDDIPLADMLYCLGAVVVLLRVYPRVTWLSRLPALDRVVTLLNNRAMTIYLWGNAAIAAAAPVLDHSPLAQYFTAGARGSWLMFATAWLLIFVAVLLVGWVEDVAARRPPRLLPWAPARPASPALPSTRTTEGVQPNVVHSPNVVGPVPTPRREQATADRTS
ncbi:acyltransferase family protein [Modestobacter sp. SYSU DS0511]